MLICIPDQSVIIIIIIDIGAIVADSREDIEETLVDKEAVDK